MPDLEDKAAKITDIGNIVGPHDICHGCGIFQLSGIATYAVPTAPFAGKSIERQLPAGNVDLFIFTGLVVVILVAAGVLRHGNLVNLYIAALKPPYTNLNVSVCRNCIRYSNSTCNRTSVFRFKIALYPTIARHTYSSIEVAIARQGDCYSNGISRSIIAIIRCCAEFCHITRIVSIIIVGIHNSAALGYRNGIQSHLGIHPPEIDSRFFLGASLYHKFTGHAAAITGVGLTSVDTINILDTQISIIHIIRIQIDSDGDNVSILKVAVIGRLEGIGFVILGSGIDETLDLLVLVAPGQHFNFDILNAHGCAADIPDAKLNGIYNR